MRVSTDISHWVCVLMGLFLVLVALVSHTRRHVAGAGALPGDETHPGIIAGKRAVLIAIGMIAVTYGLVRMIP